MQQMQQMRQRKIERYLYAVCGSFAGGMPGRIGQKSARLMAGLAYILPLLSM